MAAILISSHRCAPAGGRPPRGFTLVEMLVVVALITVLAALLFPALTNAIEKARFIQCQNKISQICKAYVQYTQDSGGVRPYVAPVAFPIPYRWTSQRISGRDVQTDPITATGLGKFIDEGYLSQFDDLWCPAITKAGYHDAEYRKWTNRTEEAECGYLYLWYMAAREPFPAMTPAEAKAYEIKVSNHDYQSAKKWNAFVMDVNTADKSGFLSHPKLHKINIGFIDGHVHGFDSRGELLLSTPITLQKMDQVWMKAHSLATTP